MLKKIFFGIIFILIGVCAIGLAYIYFAPDIPENSEALIHKVKEESLPELLTGEARFAKNGDISIWYEVSKPKDTIKGTILLVMGYGSTATQWPGYFTEPLISTGYQVIKYDHRDIGKSSWIDDWTAASAYDLSDMAADAKAILDAENISSAHIVGVSMGGMICQTMSIKYPETIASMTSIMSTGFYGDESMKSMSSELLRNIARYTARFTLFSSPLNDYKFPMTASTFFKGDQKLDYIYNIQRTRYELERRNGFNPNAGKHHEAAITISGSRYEELKKLDLPTLIIHGKNDPLIPIEHGYKTSELIPNARSLWIDGMGHDIPKVYSSIMTNGILEFLDSDVF